MSDQSKSVVCESDEQGMPQTLPSRDGNAGHTLTEGALGAMVDVLVRHEPGCTSTALTLLKRYFPEEPLDLHRKACTLFSERL